MVMVRGCAGWVFPLDHSACAKGVLVCGAETSVSPGV